MPKIGFKHSLESKRKMSFSRKGIPLSEETKLKISMANKGKYNLGSFKRGADPWNKRYLNNKNDIARRLNEMKIINDTGCWEWKGMDKTRYGTIYIEGKSYQVHRVAAWLYSNFDLNSDLLVCHTCDNPPCFNPEHLFVGTGKDNMEDMFKKGRDNFLKGSEHHMAVLTDKDIIQIRKERVLARPVDLAKKYNVTPTQIVRICKGKSWKHLPPCI